MCRFRGREPEDGDRRKVMNDEWIDLSQKGSRGCHFVIGSGMP
jgi:hypothetical protein